MSQKRYKVGQVVYVIMSEENRIVPFQVIEEVTKKTLQGETIIYKVFTGGDASKKQYVLSDLRGEVFETLLEVKQFLMQNVTNWVNNQVATAQKKAEAWYKVHASVDSLDDEALVVHSVPAAQEQQSEEDDGVSLVELPDGKLVKARVTRAHQA